MKRMLLSLVTLAVLATTMTLGTEASAKEVTIQKGDTLWNISQKHNVSVNDLKVWNELSSNLIIPNQRLIVSPSETYIVKEGDTLSAIAAKYENVSTKDLIDWNQIQNPSLLKINDKLIIHVKRSDKQQNAEVKSVSTNSNSGSQKNSNRSNETNSSSEVKELTMTATAYTASCEGCSGITATGIDLNKNPNKKVISVDPSVIPLGSKVYVEGYGYAIAGDTGSSIKGNKIDIFLADKQDAINWGSRKVKVKVLN
ncbi:3D domain-containing protein [Halalkalibacter urbisdiaboli]|uniref:3D domain-containing protein n=1 Tax=Halalkalibacter urbisdiaboli TaxID=1960589 RepID=UPI000B430B68|nr:3D domain-containing protein [Halalkalibacter urbisdiaboli]